MDFVWIRSGCLESDEGRKRSSSSLLTAVLAMLVTALLVSACDGRHDAIGVANGTSRPFEIVEIVADRDTDGGLLDPGDVHYFDSQRGFSRPLEIRDERGVMLSRIDEMAHCRQDPVFTVTDELLQEAWWATVDNCRSPSTSVREGLPGASPVVVDSEGLILQARWRDPGNPGESRHWGSTQVRGRLLEDSEPDKLRIWITGTSCIPELTVTVVDELPLSLDLRPGPEVPLLGCPRSEAAVHTLELVLDRPVDLESVMLSITPAPMPHERIAAE